MSRSNNDGAAKSRSELAANIAASGITGFSVMIATNPLDTAKQRFQISAVGGSGSNGSLASFFSRIVRTEGLIGLWKPAIVTNACCCTVSVGFRIGFYPLFRDALGDMPVLAGLASGGVGYLCAAPLFHAKNRIQVSSGRLSVDGKVMLTGARKGLAPAPQTGIGVLADVMRTDGILAWWRGAHLLVARGAILSSAQLSTYDYCKRFATRQGISDGPLLHLGASVVAAASAVTAMIPADVVLTTYQGGSSATGTTYRGVWHCARSMYADHKTPLIFFRGWTFMFARMLPSSLLSFLLFEQIRSWFGLDYLD